MSVIAWDGRHMVADNQVTHGNVPKKIKKIFKFQRNKIAHAAGFVGEAANGLELVKWFKDGADPTTMPDHPDTELIIATASTCFSYENGNPVPVRIFESYYATGSGGDFATSALAMGHSAREAVKHAIKHDVYCGMGTTSIKL